jgi:mRNA-degrading endonuclease toxin of MazEF toxin-antitoxin module
MRLSPGDIVIVEHIPQDDPTARKARPALVISTSDFNDRNIDVIVLLMSSVIRQNIPTNYMIGSNEPYFKQTGLRAATVIKCGTICSFPKQKIKRRIGMLPKDILEHVINSVVGLFPSF